MKFEVIGDIRDMVELIAWNQCESSVFRKAYGSRRRRKLKGIATVDLLALRHEVRSGTRRTESERGHLKFKRHSTES